MLASRRLRSLRAFLALAAVVAFVATATALQPLANTGEAPAASDAHANLIAAVAAIEYDLQILPAGGATAPSRRQGLRTTWQDGTVRVTPRATDGAWSLSFALARVGRTGTDGGFHGRDVSGVTRESVAGNRLDWTRDGVSEWWTNSPLGVEQSLAIAERPAGSRRRPVVVESALAGLASASRTDAGGLAFFAADGAEVLRVNGVTALDARGAAIPAWMDFQDGILRIGYADRGAVYPVVLDPLFTSPEEILSYSTQNNAFFGSSVASAGDVNRDGFADVLVGAPVFDNGQTDEGAVFLFMGEPEGIGTVPAWLAESNQGGAQLGFAVAGARDVDGDGYADVLLGAPLYNGLTTSDGAVFLYLGGPGGLGPTGTPLNADWFAYGQQGAGRFGAAVALGGNLDGSGLSAVVVGAPKQRSAPSAPTADGAVLVWLAGGANSAAATAGSGLPTQRATADVILGGLQSQSQFGISVAGPGDVNGDGVDDLLVGADLYDAGQTNEGRAFVYLGPLMMPAVAAWTAESDQAGAQFGYSVSGAGDVNCDMHADIIIGAPYGEGRYKTASVYREGFAVVYYGGAAGLGAPGTLLNADWSAESDQSGVRFGWSVSAVPPGRCGACGGEVLIGSPYLKVSGRTAAGGAFGWESDGSGLGPDGRALINADWAVTGDDAGDQAGYAVAGLKDVDGDGQGDAIVGVPYGEGISLANGGEAHVFLSSGDPKCSGCGSDEDCNDFDVCTDDYCDLDTGECIIEDVDCDDGDPCTEDLCVSNQTAKGINPVGGCQHLPPDCDDMDPCTIDSCDPLTGECSYEPVDCADKDACTDDSCQPSLMVVFGAPVDYECVHQPRDCDDGDPCTTDSCDIDGNCQHDEIVCDDGNVCTDDQCVADDPVFASLTPGGHCEFTPVNCEDGNTCTFDTCVPNENFAFGAPAEYTCEHEAVDCDDGNPCTIDTCVPQPTFGPGSLPAGCENTPIVCPDDGDDCNGVETCVNGVCMSLNPVVCKDDGDDCNGTETCVDGACQSVDPVVCEDDGDPCTDDYCFEGACIHPEASCDDMDACTDDSCASMLKTVGGPPCVHEPHCPDMGPCVLVMCADGACASTPIDCDDMDACTDDSCNGMGVCVHAPVDIDDMDACTTDACDAMTGVSHTPVDIDDMDACTTDACDPGTGDISHVAVDIADMDACTTDACDPETGNITHTPVDIDDMDACTTDACDPGTGNITHAPVAGINDGNACTTDACDPGTGNITHTPVDIDDMDACTTDACDPGTGNITHTPVAGINDGNACTTDACDPMTGNITHTPIVCNDGNACTIDTCNPATGCVFTPVVCNDGNSCTTDTCNPATGCVFTPVGGCVPENTDVLCRNGIDDDGDTLADCADPDCLCKTCSSSNLSKHCAANNTCSNPTCP